MPKRETLTQGALQRIVGGATDKDIESVCGPTPTPPAPESSSPTPESSSQQTDSSGSGGGPRR